MGSVSTHAVDKRGPARGEDRLATRCSGQVALLLKRGSVCAFADSVLPAVVSFFVFYVSLSDHFSGVCGSSATNVWSPRFCVFSVATVSLQHQCIFETTERDGLRASVRDSCTQLFPRHAFFASGPIFREVSAAWRPFRFVFLSASPLFLLIRFSAVFLTLLSATVSA